MNIAQRVYNRIRYWKAPKWYVDLMAAMQKAATDAFLSFTAEELALIKAEIIEVAGTNLEGDDKFKAVFAFCKAEFKDKKDDAINSVITNTYSALKNSLVVNK